MDQSLFNLWFSVATKTLAGGTGVGLDLKQMYLIAGKVAFGQSQSDDLGLWGTRQNLR